jgi:hypothetical protein
MTKGILCFMSLCFFVASCHAQETAKETSYLDIKEDFKNYLLTQYNDVKISEIYSKKSNKKDYLKKSLGDLLLKEVLDVKAQDLYFKELSEKFEAHLGIAYLNYKTPDMAKKSLSSVEPKGFFENTKILTQYVATNVGAVNIIVYSESAANKTALNYLGVFTNRLVNVRPTPPIDRIQSD